MNEPKPSETEPEAQSSPSNPNGDETVHPSPLPLEFAENADKAPLPIPKLSVENRVSDGNCRLISACMKHIEKLLHIVATQAMNGLYLDRKPARESVKEIRLIIADYSGVGYITRKTEGLVEIFLSSQHLESFSKRYAQRNTNY
jgi:hypothetical protein